MVRIKLVRLVLICGLVLFFSCEKQNKGKGSNNILGTSSVLNKGDVLYLNNCVQCHYDLNEDSTFIKKFKTQSTDALSKENYHWIISNIENETHDIGIEKLSKKDVEAIQYYFFVMLNEEPKDVP